MRYGPARRYCSPFAGASPRRRRSARIAARMDSSAGAAAPRGTRINTSALGAAGLMALASALMAATAFASSRAAPCSLPRCVFRGSIAGAMIGRAVGAGWNLVGEWLGSACDLVTRIREHADPLVRVLGLGSGRIHPPTPLVRQPPSLR